MNRLISFTTTIGGLRLLVFSVVFSGLTVGAATTDNWPRWRGSNDNGSIERSGFPTRWSEDQIVWKAALPGKGCSTPIIWNDRIYVTAPTNDLDAVLVFDTAGKLLRQTVFGPEDPGKHRNGSGSNASPATDGEGVYVYFKSGTLAAVEMDGSRRWQTNLVERFGKDTLFWDQGTSPVVTDRYVVMARMHGGDSWLAAFDKASGEMAWLAPRNYETPVEGDNAYTTPQRIEHDGREALLVWGAEHLTVHDTRDGSVLWSCGEFNPQARAYWPGVASPVLVGDIAVVPTGRNDRSQPRLHGIRTGGSGDVTSTHRVWKSEDTGTFVPTPAEYLGRVYLLRDRGEIDCVDPETGEVLWSESLPRHRSNYYSSPFIAGGILYAAREDGIVMVARVVDGFELLAENDLGERVIASLVPLGNRLLVRGEQHLFCIGER